MAEEQRGHHKPETEESKSRGFDSTLPLAGRPRPDAKDDGATLDLELGDIETRLPYGSEDIADK